MNISSEQPKIVVVGSSTVDLVLNTDHIPQQNETIIASKVENFFGGKGANQAVGTARLGASVHLISCVGMDPLGQQVLRNLVDEGVNVAFVAETETADTGTAYVTASHGRTSIVVVPAANYELHPAHINEAERIFPTADMVLLQLEIPVETAEHAAKMAKKNQVKLGIYAAPAAKLSDEILEYAAFIVVKRNEMEHIFGEESPDEILKKYPNKLFLRDDTNSTTYFNGTEMKYFRNDHDEVSHKMGMGDAFTSGFAVAFCHGNPIEECVKFGNKVSLKVAKNSGSQSGLPFLKDLS